MNSNNLPNLSLGKKSKDDYDFITNEGVKIETLSTGQEVLLIQDALLETVSNRAFNVASFRFEESHIRDLILCCNKPSSSKNDKLVIASILQNAQIAFEGKLPLCQDTGVANIFGFKDNNVVVNGNEYAALSRGALSAYKANNLRFSTVKAKDFFTEYDPKDNSPAFIFLEEKCPQSSPPEYQFLFCAKGGGSSNKTQFFQCTKALLNKEAFTNFLKENIPNLGVSACPPYTICCVVGGLSPEQNLLALKLATCTVDIAPVDTELSSLLQKIACDCGYGAQFGGARMCLNAKVLRLPRHAASCPVSIGVSCSAHRNIKAFIDKDGAFIQKTVEPALVEGFASASSYSISETQTIFTDRGIKNMTENLRKIAVGAMVQISGKILVARDAAHARWYSLLQEGKSLPSYCMQYPICYAGPSQTPQGFVIGSFGPTTAGRMDFYAQSLMSQGASLVTIAKGNRSKEYSKMCKKYGGFYLGAIGGVAALIASTYIKSQEIIDYSDLGMEAVRLVEVVKLPVFVLIDDKGNDFYAHL